MIMTKIGAILSDYKSGAILDFEKGAESGELKLAYKEQMELYAALYRFKFAVWPIRVEVVPLQGAPMEVIFNPKDAETLLSEASNFLRISNKRIVEVENGIMTITSLATPRVSYCRLCLFRPACQAYWDARVLESQEKWPADVKGRLRDITRLRNGKVCIRVETDGSSTSSYQTIRNVTDSTDRHPSLNLIPVGGHVSIYGLKHHYLSGDYTETQYTVIFTTD